MQGVYQVVPAISPWEGREEAAGAEGGVELERSPPTAQQLIHGQRECSRTELRCPGLDHAQVPHQSAIGCRPPQEGV